MTHAEFTSRFLATMHNTDGFTAAQLDAINAAVFADAAHLDADDSATKSTVDALFAREFDKE